MSYLLSLSRAAFRPCIRVLSLALAFVRWVLWVAVRGGPAVVGALQRHRNNAGVRESPEAPREQDEMIRTRGQRCVLVLGEWGKSFIAAAFGLAFKSLQPAYVC